VTLPAIWIATTRGPVEVVSITEEDPDIRSVLCLADSFQELPISPLYDAFVRRPTGLIEQMTGHPSYRVDLSGPITQGHSWQVGLTVMHLFHAKPNKSAANLQNSLLWATGKVTPKGIVQPVGEIKKKWQTTLDAFDKKPGFVDSVLVIAHPTNIAEIQAIESDSPSELAIKWVPATSIIEIANYFNLTTGIVETTPITSRRQPVKRILAAVAFGLSCIFGGGHLAMEFAAPLTRLDAEGRYRELFMELREMRQDGNWLEVNGAFFFEKYLRQRATRLATDVHIKIQLIPGTGATCAMARSATITTNTLPSWINNKCQFQITLGNKSDQFIGVWAALHSHKESGTPNMVLQNHASLQPTQSVTLPTFTMDESTKSQGKTLLIMVSMRPDTELLPWFSALSSTPHPSTKMTRRIEKSGTGVRFAQGSVSDI
jgi:hypothetical protein